MSSQSDGGPAFPRPFSYTMHGGTSFQVQEGMSLRDYFAGQYLAGFIANRGYAPTDVGNLAYDAADKLITAREK